MAWLTNPSEAGVHGSEAARKALALDSNLAEVQFAAAMVQAYVEWDWEGGEAAFLKALEINPNYVEARAFYAPFLAIMGRTAEARAHMDRALDLDPFNPMWRINNAGVLTYERRYAELIEEYEAVLRIDPENLVAHSFVASAYHMNGNYEKALVHMRRAPVLDRGIPPDQGLVEALDQGNAEGGYQVALRRYAENLAARPEAADFLAWPTAAAYAFAGDRERTLEWLERAYQVHEPNFVTITSPGFDLVREDPRYHDLRRRMGMPVGVKDG